MFPCLTVSKHKWETNFSPRSRSNVACNIYIICLLYSNSGPVSTFIRVRHSSQSFMVARSHTDQSTPPICPQAKHTVILSDNIINSNVVQTTEASIKITYKHSDAQHYQTFRNQHTHTLSSKHTFAFRPILRDSKFLAQTNEENHQWGLTSTPSHIIHPFHTHRKFKF